MFIALPDSLDIAEKNYDTIYTVFSSPNRQMNNTFVFNNQYIFIEAKILPAY